MSPLQDTGLFIIGVLFGIYILLVVMRFLLQWVQADFYNPVSQLIMKATQPVLAPLRRYVPSVAGLDTASLLLMFVLQLIELWLSAAIIGLPAGILSLCLLSVARLLQLVAYVFMFSIFVMVILSWIQPRSYNPAIGLMNSLSAPIMRPLRQLIPAIGGLDVSPIAALLILGVVLRLLIQPLAMLSGISPPL
jgi:YggT family protein